MTEQIKQIEDDCDVLKEKIIELEKEIQTKNVNDQKTREEENKKHDDFVNEFRKKNNVLKDEIKTKLSSHFK